MTFSTPASDTSRLWEARALDRALETARARSTDRIHRIVGAARELADETGSSTFTIVQLAQRAGLSLKSVYRSFASKDDILLALLEEESRIGAELLRTEIDRYDEPVRRVQAFVEGIFGLLTHPGAVGYAGVLVREYRRLSELHPDGLRASLSPLVDLLAAEIEGAAGVGMADLRPVRRAAETVFALVLGGIAEVTLGRAEPEESAAWFWRFCASGLGIAVTAPATAPTGRG